MAKGASARAAARRQKDKWKAKRWYSIRAPRNPWSFKVIGETLAERKSNRTDRVLRRQLDAGIGMIDEEDLRRVTIAYEPIWAIGTGLNATAKQIAEAHQILRRLIEKAFPGAASQLVVQYGGSVNRGNCKELSEVSEVNGFLIGGASLDVDQFAEIVETITEVKNR